MNHRLIRSPLFLVLLFSVFQVFSCDDANADQSLLYFPPANGDWETIHPSAAGYDSAKLQEALDYAGANRSSGVVILYQGRILAEQYWEPNGVLSSKFKDRRTGRNASNRAIEDVASTQKSVASILVGIAQQNGLLSLGDRVDQHLGIGWSRASPEQERAITIRHLITMTSGLTERGAFEAPAGEKWRYNTTVYAKSMEVLEKVAKKDRNELTREWLTRPLGMSDSKWVPRGSPGLQNVNAYGFATTARDLARFGLLALAGGNWDDTQILTDKQYLKEATTSSQTLNPFYGYLWWVNENAFESSAVPRVETAPRDMYSAKGALIRRCYVVPSLQLVVTRLGDQPKTGRSFDQQFWKLLTDAKL